MVSFAAAATDVFFCLPLLLAIVVVVVIFVVVAVFCKFFSIVHLFLCLCGRFIIQRLYPCRIWFRNICIAWCVLFGHRACLIFKSRSSSRYQEFIRCTQNFGIAADFIVDTRKMFTNFFSSNSFLLQQFGKQFTASVVYRCHVHVPYYVDTLLSIYTFMFRISALAVLLDVIESHSVFWFSFIERTQLYPFLLSACFRFFMFIASYSLEWMLAPVIFIIQWPVHWRCHSFPFNWLDMSFAAHVRLL